MNVGLKGGADGLIELNSVAGWLTQISGLFVELFSILTDNSLVECFLIRVVAHTNKIIEMIEAPIPIRGHLIVSSKDLGCCLIVITCLIFGLINFVVFFSIFSFSNAGSTICIL